MNELERQMITINKKIDNKVKHNRFRILMAVIAFLCAGCFSLPAQQLVTGKQAQSAVESMTASYMPWRSVSWSGKLKSGMLPVSVTVKTYMLRDSLTLISLRAPLIGEVARVEIDNRTILFANKMNKKYLRYDIGSFGSRGKMLHSNLQDILIGRAVIVGQGVLNKKDFKQADIYSLGEDGWLVAARLPDEAGGANYGYAIDAAGQMLELMIKSGKTGSAEAPDGMSSITENITFEASAVVKYQNSEASADIQAVVFHKEYEASLQNVKTEWGTSGFGRLDISKYTSGTLRDLLKF